jgi:hypothetical protein
MFFFTKSRVDKIFFSIKGKRGTVIIGFLDCIQEKRMARQGKQVLGEQAALQRSQSYFFGRLHRTTKVDTIINYSELFNAFL